MADLKKQYPVRTRQPLIPQSLPSDTQATVAREERCSVYPCLYSHPEGVVAFQRYADLQRHVAIVHANAPLERVDCIDPGCHRRGHYGFSRKDKMVEHMREVHKITSMKDLQRRRSTSSSNISIRSGSTASTVSEAVTPISPPSPGWSPLTSFSTFVQQFDAKSGAGGSGDFEVEEFEPELSEPRNNAERALIWPSTGDLSTVPRSQQPVHASRCDTDDNVKDNHNCKGPPFQLDSLVKGSHPVRNMIDKAAGQHPDTKGPPQVPDNNFDAASERIGALHTAIRSLKRKVYLMTAITETLSPSITTRQGSEKSQRLRADISSPATTGPELMFIRGEDAGALGPIVHHSDNSWGKDRQQPSGHRKFAGVLSHAGDASSSAADACNGTPSAGLGSRGSTGDSRRYEQIESEDDTGSNGSGEGGKRRRVSAEGSISAIHLPCLYRIACRERNHNHVAEYRYISKLLHHLRTSHHSYACAECFMKFDNEAVLEEHKRDHVKACSNKACRRRISRNRRLTARCECVCSGKPSQLWRGLFQLEFPDTPFAEVDIPRRFRFLIGDVPSTTEQITESIPTSSSNSENADVFDVDSAAWDTLPQLEGQGLPMSMETSHLHDGYPGYTRNLDTDWLRLLDLPRDNSASSATDLPAPKGPREDTLAELPQALPGYSLDRAAVISQSSPGGLSYPTGRPPIQAGLPQQSVADTDQVLITAEKPNASSSLEIGRNLMTQLERLEKQEALLQQQIQALQKALQQMLEHKVKRHIDQSPSTS